MVWFKNSIGLDKRWLSKVKILYKKSSWRYSEIKWRNLETLPRKWKSCRLNEANFSKDFQSVWLRGPHWLKQLNKNGPENEYYDSKMINISTILISSNRKKTFKTLFPTNRYGSWKRILEITAYVLQFVSHYQRKHY